MRDTGAMTDECEHFDEPDDGAKRAARRVIAANSIDVAECDEFLRMCGLHPTQWKDPAILTSASRII